MGFYSFPLFALFMCFIKNKTVFFYHFQNTWTSAQGKIDISLNNLIPHTRGDAQKSSLPLNQLTSPTSPTNSGFPSQMTMMNNNNTHSMFTNSSINYFHSIFTISSSFSFRISALPTHGVGSRPILK